MSACLGCILTLQALVGISHGTRVLVTVVEVYFLCLQLFRSGNKAAGTPRIVQRQHPYRWMPISVHTTGKTLDALLGHSSLVPTETN